jgi:hypothetical protein
MSISVNRNLFDRVKRIIAVTGRVNMKYWAGVQDASPATFVGEIRELPLLQHRRSFACVAAWACFLATGEEVARAIRAYRLVGGVIDDPFTMAAVLLLSGAKDVESAKAACRSLFLLVHWPECELEAYRNSRTDEERRESVLRRMDNWIAEIKASRKQKPSRPRCSTGTLVRT